MQIDFNHDSRTLLGDDTSMYDSMKASLDSFYASLSNASAGQREAMVASAIAALTSGAGRAADSVYASAKADGRSEADAKAAAQNTVALYKRQEDAYRQAALDVAAAEARKRSAALVAEAARARLALDQDFGYAPKAKGSMTVPLIAAAVGIYLATR